MSEKLTSLLDYSRQEMRVGTPPRFIFDAAGHVLDRELVALSVQLRIAESLERKTALPAASRWISVSTLLPEPRPGSTASWAVLAAEFTGSQVLVAYDHRTGEWQGLHYQPRITHWQPLPPSPRHEEGGPADD